MNPFYFGTGRRRLFGLYTPALTKGARSRAVVLCHPWGQEFLRAHRSIRQLANMLTAAGFDVLRFDYFGTGDSAGEMVDADLKGWENDIEMAIEELKDTMGAARVTLVGLRLGATLAASIAASRGSDVDSLVLWDPVVAGDEYLRELGATASRSGGEQEILGFALSNDLERDLQAIDLHALTDSLPGRTLIIVTQPLASHAALGRALSERDAGALAIERIDGQPAWIEERNLGAGAVPVKVLQRIVQWIS